MLDCSKSINLLPISNNRNYWHLYTAITDTKSHMLHHSNKTVKQLKVSKSKYSILGTNLVCKYIDKMEHLQCLGLSTSLTKFIKLTAILQGPMSQNHMKCSWKAPVIQHSAKSSRFSAKGKCTLASFPVREWRESVKMIYW